MAASLAGKTLFITGASRGIGKAIALRAARDGANIAIAAKTVKPHPTLAGTIYTAAEEIEKAGGQCLPCVVDIRHEDQVEQAVQETVSRFGGIDILINNASAISLTGTEQTPMKRYDLMHQVNGRGTYLCSQKCLPYLRESAKAQRNPHILNISPPLNMRPLWFKNHVAYTMAKYNMSMCVLGMSEELRDVPIAVNALWPRTAIYTAAMEMLGGGSGVRDQCRRPEIMADAAYLVLLKTPEQMTGRFCIDDEVLKENGITDLEQYAYKPGAQLMPDFFLEEAAAIADQVTSMGRHQTPAASSASSAGGSGGTGGDKEIQKVFNGIEAMVTDDVLSRVNARFSFSLDSSHWLLDLSKAGSGRRVECLNAVPDTSSVDVQFSCSDENFLKIFTGKLAASGAFMTGKLKIKGNLPVAMKLEALMKTMHDRSKL